MFKSAAAKLAHSSTIPGLAGNKALRPLQALITTEKAVVTSLERLSLHFSQASEALCDWGKSEGDDLSDTLGASTKLLLEFSSSLSQFAVHEQTIRDLMKGARTQEEKLDELRDSRKCVACKADAIERKIKKMGIQHKECAVQSSLYNDLQSSKRELDSEIMAGEAKLYDFKRTVTKDWMTLKFDGLQELCRKGIIVAEAGKLIVTELPKVVTEPDHARPFYTGNARTEEYVTEALRALSNVSIDDSTSTSPQFSIDVKYQDGTPSTMPSALPDDASVISLGRGGLPGDGDGSLQYHGQYAYNASRPSLGERSDFDKSPAASQADEHGAFLPQPDATRSRSLGIRKPPPSNLPLRDDFLSPSQGIGRTQSQGGGRFATFPVKTKAMVVQNAAEPLVGSRPSLSDVKQAFPKAYLEDAPRYEAIEGAFTPPPGPSTGAAPPAVLHAGSGREAESIQEPDGRVAQDRPPLVPTKDPDDERALDTAAARGVSRVDSLMYQPPATIPGDPSPQPLATAMPTTPPVVHTSPRTSSVSPASSPIARARNRASGSSPVLRTSSERPSPTNSSPSPLGASTASSPMQQAQLSPPRSVLGHSSSPSLTSLDNSSFRTPPELPPSPSPVSSQRSLPQAQGVPFALGKSPPAARQGSGMIPAAAFRRPAARTASASGTGDEPLVTGSPREMAISLLSIRKNELHTSPNTPPMSGTGTMSPMSSLPSAQPSELASFSPEPHHEDEFDYIEAYYQDDSSPPSYAESSAQ